MHSHSVLLDGFLSSVKRAPHADAFAIGDTTTSYATLAGRVQGIRSAIDEHCRGDERFIGILATQELDTYAAILAVLASGRAYVPLNPKAPFERNSDCLRQAEIRTIVAASASSALGRWEEERGTITIYSRNCPEAEWKPPVQIEGEDLAYLLFTSGSTGSPKGVPIAHRNLNAFLTAVTEHTDWRVSSADRVLQMFDLTFDLSIMSYALPLVAGACCVVPSDGGGGFTGVSRALRRHDVTVALMVPSVLAFLEPYLSELHLPRLRLSLFCGEALSARLAHAWWQSVSNARVLNAYGPTEATIFLSTFELSRAAASDEALNGVVGLGTPLWGSEFRVVDERLQEVEDGAEGELALLGAQVTTGYWRNPERTAMAFVTLPDGKAAYRSGDLVIRRGTQYHYVGRIDHQIKIDGYRVESGEIESKARELAGVRNAVLLPAREGERVTALHLMILVSDSVDVGFAAECRRRLQASLPGYMVPHRVHLRTSFPLTANGKIDRNALSAELIGS